MLQAYRQQGFASGMEMTNRQRVGLDCFRILMARPARLERATCGFEVRRSIQLSYGRMG
jgi:hypothetical protein